MNAPIVRTLGACLCVMSLSCTLGSAGAATNTAPAWLTEPLSLAQALDTALRQNSAILKSERDLEATHGIVVQTRSIALPRLGVGGSYEFNNGIEQIALAPALPTFDFQQENNWRIGIRLEQSIYEGGRMRSAFRSARHLQGKALAEHRAVINETLFEVRSAYYDTLLAAEQIKVNEKSVALLQKELEDTRRRYEAGTVPRFNVLRAEVQVANAKPELSRARNAWRISKNNLANLLGFDLPTNVWENIPLRLTGKLTREPFEINLPDALNQALQNRPELAALDAAKDLATEEIVKARSGYLPSLQVFGGYSGRSSSFKDDLGFVVDGWLAGAELNWNLFDGRLTQGRVQEAKANVGKVQVELEDVGRQVELDVRTSYSGFIEAREVLDSTEKVVEQAEEALRLATARYDAGTGTQLDVLAAETSLTEARTTQNVALRDYSVALARLERAIGVEYVPVKPSLPASDQEMPHGE